MIKSHKNHKMRKCRTSLEIEEEQSRTLFIRIPHTIKNAGEIRSLFFGDFKVKLPRQSSRYCHVIFANVKEKMQNLKKIKQTLIDGKPIVACPPRLVNLEKPKKQKQKKIVMPEPVDDTKIGKYLFVSNIPAGVKASEVKDAFPGSATVALLKGLVNGARQARVKMSSIHLCLRYHENSDEWPTLRGKKVSVFISKKSKNVDKKKKAKKTKSLKIYDESEKSSMSKNLKEVKKKKESNDDLEKEDNTDSNDDSFETEEEDDETEDTEEEKQN